MLAFTAPSLSGLDVFEAELLQARAHIVHVETERSRGKRRPRLVLACDARPALLGDGVRLAQGNDADPVIVGDDDVAGTQRGTGADDRHVDTAERGLHCAFGAHRSRPHRELQLRKRPDIAAPGVDDEAFDAMGLE